MIDTPEGPRLDKEKVCLEAAGQHYLKPYKVKEGEKVTPATPFTEIVQKVAREKNLEAASSSEPPPPQPDAADAPMEPADSSAPTKYSSKKAEEMARQNADLREAVKRKQQKDS